METLPSFWLVFAAVVLGGVAAKLVSLAIDAIVWLRSLIVEVAAELRRRKK